MQFQWLEFMGDDMTEEQGKAALEVVGKIEDDIKNRLFIALDMICHGCFIGREKDIRRHAAECLKATGYYNHNIRAALESSPISETQRESEIKKTAISETQAALDALNEADECFQPETLEELQKHFPVLRAALKSLDPDDQELINTKSKLEHSMAFARDLSRQIDAMKQELAQTKLELARSRKQPVPVIEGLEDAIERATNPQMSGDEALDLFENGDFAKIIKAARAHAKLQKGIR